MASGGGALPESVEGATATLVRSAPKGEAQGLGDRLDDCALPDEALLIVAHELGVATLAELLQGARRCPLGTSERSRHIRRGHPTLIEG